MKTLQKEEWRSISGYEGFYEVSSLGQVRRLPGFTTAGHRWSGRILKQILREKGYFSVCLCRGAKKTVQVHLLVATAFHGERPSGMQAGHLDGNSENNHSRNLSWITPKENQFHRWAHGTMEMVLGENNNKAVLTRKQVDQIRSLHASTGWGCRRVARKLGISEYATNHVLTGDSWKHRKNIFKQTVAPAMNRGARHFRAKITMEDADKIREAHKTTGLGYIRLSRKLGYTKGVVAGILRGNSWKRHGQLAG